MSKRKQHLGIAVAEELKLKMLDHMRRYSWRYGNQSHFLREAIISKMKSDELENLKSDATS